MSTKRPNCFAPWCGVEGPCIDCASAVGQKSDRQSAETSSAVDIALLWKARRDGNDPAKNARQKAILDLWEAWLGEGTGDYDVEVVEVPHLLERLWELSGGHKR